MRQSTRVPIGVLVFLSLVFLVSTSHAGVYYVVHRLLRHADGSVAPSAGASFLFIPGDKPTARELAKANAAEEAKKSDVVKVWVVREGEDDSVAVETNGNPNLVAGALSVDQEFGSTKAPVDSDDLTPRLKRVKRNLEQTLYRVGRSKRNDVANAVSRVRRFSSSFHGMVGSLNEQNFKDLNAVISEYNQVATDLGAGPLAESFGDLPELKALSPHTEFTAKDAQERALSVEAKLKEIGLRLEKREFEARSEALEVEMQQIAAGKADGIDVSEQEKELAEAITAFESEKSKFQKEIGGYTEFRDKLDTVRKEIKEEKLAADQAKREEEERLAAAKRREEERIAAEKRRQEERIAAAREKEMADKIADQNQREAEAVRRPSNQSRPPRDAARSTSVVGTWEGSNNRTSGEVLTFDAAGTYKSRYGGGTWTQDGDKVKISGTIYPLTVQGNRLIGVNGGEYVRGR